jgi:hypothetical protein
MPRRGAPPEEVKTRRSAALVPARQPSGRRGSTSAATNRVVKGRGGRRVPSHDAGAAPVYLAGTQHQRRAAAAVRREASINACSCAASPRAEPRDRRRPGASPPLRRHQNSKALQRKSASPPAALRRLPLHCRPSPPSPRCCRRALVQAARGGRHLACGLHAMPPSRAPLGGCAAGGAPHAGDTRRVQQRTRQAGTRPRPAPRRLRAALRRCHRQPHRVTAIAGVRCPRRPIAAPSLHSSRAPFSPAHPHHTLSLTHSHAPPALPAHPPRTVLRLPPSLHAAAWRHTISNCASRAARSSLRAPRAPRAP